MPYTIPMSETPISQKYNLEDRIALIESNFDTSTLINRQTQDTKMISKYYRINKLPYKIAHSKDGFVHMGISRSGTFSKDDFYEQAHMVDSYIKSSNLHSPPNQDTLL